MHPVNYLFEEINRNVWGIPEGGAERKRKHAEKPAWRRRGSTRRISLL